MSLRRMLIWGLPAVAYAAFVRWYTDFGGPLDESEIETYLARLDAPDHSGSCTTSTPTRSRPTTDRTIPTPSQCSSYSSADSPTNAPEPSPNATSPGRTPPEHPPEVLP